MITEGKIKVYKRYNGDIDSWVRSGTKKEKLNMTDEDWYLIGDFIQDLVLVKKGLASLDFNKTLKAKLQEKCDNNQTVEQLQKLAKEV